MNNYKNLTKTMLKTLKINIYIIITLMNTNHHDKYNIVNKHCQKGWGELWVSTRDATPDERMDGWILFCLKSLNPCCLQVSFNDEGLLKFSKLEKLVLRGNKLTEMPAEKLPSSVQVCRSSRTLPFRVPAAIMEHGSPLEASGAPVQPAVFPGRAGLLPRLQHSGLLL